MLRADAKMTDLVSSDAFLLILDSYEALIAENELLKKQLKDAVQRNSKKIHKKIPESGRGR